MFCAKPTVNPTVLGRVVERVAHMVDLNEFEWLRTQFVEFHSVASMILNTP